MSNNAIATRWCAVDIICNPDFKERIDLRHLHWLSERTGKTWAKCENGQVFEEDYTFSCEHCLERHHIGTSCSVYVRGSQPGRRNREAEWCEGCRDNNAFYCEGTSEYHSTEDYTSVRVEGAIWCLERNEDDLYYWESDSNYHTEPEPEEEDGNDEDSSGVAGYHSLRRPWNHRTPPPGTIGVELETWASSACDHACLATRLGLLAERDGSLCNVHGVEIIGPPMLISEYPSPSSPWRRLFESASRSFKAWDAGENYGMHVNINREGMGKLHQAKFICFIHGHKKFCEQVAGRSELHWAAYTPKRIGQCGVGRNRDDGKYEAAALRYGRIEVRIFRATRKWESFMKNVEFCDAVRAYTGEKALVDLNLPDFLSYVGAQPGRWPNFCAWLSARMSKVNGSIPIIHAAAGGGAAWAKGGALCAS